jgi:hypothetical protein
MHSSDSGWGLVASSCEHENELSDSAIVEENLMKFNDYQLLFSREYDFLH